MAEKYTNELFTAFTGKVNSSFTESIRKVNTELTNLGKSAEDTGKRFRKVDIGKLNSNMTQGAKSAKSYSLALGDVGRAIQVIATFQVASNLIGRITQALSSGTDALIQYDQALKNLQAITGASEGEIAVLGDTILKISNSTKFSSEEVANAAVVLGQAGFSATETIQSLDAVASLATGTLSDFKTTADLMASTLRAFELQASDSAKVADIFAVSINKSKLNMEDLRVILSYVGPAAHTAGLSLEETAGAVQLLKNQGIKASTVATGLRNVLAKMLAPTSKMRAEMSKLGIAVSDVNPSVVGIEQALKNVAPLLQNTKTGAVDVGKAFQLFQLRGAQAALVLTKMANSGDFQRVVELTKEQGAAAEMQAKQQEGLEIQLKNLSDRWKNIMVLLGDAGATKIISQLTEALSSMGLAIQEVIKGYIKLEEFIGRNTTTGIYHTKYVVKAYKAEKLRTEQLLNYSKQLQEINSAEKAGADTTQRKLRIASLLKAEFPDLTPFVDKYYNDLSKLSDALTINATDSLSKATKMMDAESAQLTERLAKVRTDIAKMKEFIATPPKEGMWGEFLTGLQQTTNMLSGKDSPQEVLNKLQVAEANIMSTIASTKEEISTPLKVDTNIPTVINQIASTLEDLGDTWVSEASRLEKASDYVGLDVLRTKAVSAKKAIEDMVTTMGYTGEVADAVSKQFSAKYFEEYKKSIGKAAAALSKLTKAEKDRMKLSDIEFKNKQRVLKDETAAQLNLIKIEEQQANTQIINQRHNSAILTRIKIESAQQQEVIELDAARKSIEIERDRIKALINIRETSMRSRTGFKGSDLISDATLQQFRAQLRAADTELEASQYKIRTEYTETFNKLNTELEKNLQKNPDTFARAWSNAITHVKDQATQDFTDIQDKVEDVADQIGSGLTDSIVGFADGTKSASEAFADMTKSILSDIAKMIIKMQIMQAIGSVMGMFSGGGTALPYGPTPSGGNIATPTFHSGGVVGASSSSGISKNIDPSMFINAPRFHSGGEVNAVLQEGEKVLTKEDRLRSADSGPKDIKIEIKNESGTPLGVTSASTGMSMEQQIIQVVIGAVNRNTAGLRTIISSV
jgi:TP901 family phage tail tape measure protein/lambda family phage tail tape measure protein